MARARVGLTQRVEDLADLGERRDALDQAWTALLDGCGFTAVPIPNRLSDPGAFAAELDLALLVLTGGNDLAHLAGAATPAPERDATELALIDHAVAHGIPVLGVCRGLQVLVTRSGGSLHPVTGHVGVPHAIESVGPTRWPLRAGPVSSYHDWGIAVDEVGAGLEVLALAADGTVEAVADPTRPVVGIMWHPERAPADDTDLELITALVGAR